MARPRYPGPGLRRDAALRRRRRRLPRRPRRDLHPARRPAHHLIDQPPQLQLLRADRKPYKMFRWYVINTYSGHENKVKHNLEHRVQTMGQARRVRQVVVPTEEVQEIKDGKKVNVEKRTMPGYVLVQMEMTDDAWGLVKNTPGVTGFVGSRNKPLPLSQTEVDNLLHTETPGQAAAAGCGRRRGRAASREAEAPRSVRDRRDRQGHLRPALRLLRRDRRDQRRRRQAQGARLDLRPRDPGRGRLRPGQEGLGGTPWPRKSSH